MNVNSRRRKLYYEEKEAPQGFIWNANSCHVLVSSEEPGLCSAKEAKQDLKERVAMGVSQCPDLPNCEWCNPEKE